MEDMERMTLGMWIDYIIEYNNIEYRAKKQMEEADDGKERPTVRRATQADFDRF